MRTLIPLAGAVFNATVKNQTTEGYGSSGVETDGIDK